MFVRVRERGRWIGEREGGGGNRRERKERKTRERLLICFIWICCTGKHCMAGKGASGSSAAHTGPKTALVLQSGWCIVRVSHLCMPLSNHSVNACELKHCAHHFGPLLWTASQTPCLWIAGGGCVDITKDAKNAPRTGTLIPGPAFVGSTLLFQLGLMRHCPCRISFPNAAITQRWVESATASNTPFTGMSFNCCFDLFSRVRIATSVVALTEDRFSRLTGLPQDPDVVFYPQECRQLVLPASPLRLCLDWSRRKCIASETTCSKVASKERQATKD